MKIKKISEELNIKNYSDLDGWNTKKKIDYDNSKIDINHKLGKSVLELFEKYNIQIDNIGDRNFLNDNEILLPNEKNKKEYGITLSYMRDDEDVLSYFGYDVICDLSKEELAEFNEERKIILDKEFSIVVSTDFNSKSFYEKQLITFEWCSKYLKYLLNFNDFEKYPTNNVIDDVFNDDVEGLKKFIIQTDGNIKNDNIEIIHDYSTRIRKDTKFIVYLKDEFYHIDINNLFLEWIKLIKNN
jgi:hypothetical protein